MDVQERWDRARRPATEAADVSACCLDAARRPFDPIREMDQAEIELRLRAQRQGRKRQIIRIVESLARNRQMNPVERPPDPRCDLVGEFHELARVFRLLEMSMAGVAVTKMIAQLY